MLGLAPTATTDEIRSKWRHLFVLIDPENTNDQFLKGRAEAAARIVSWAKDTLDNEEARRLDGGSGLRQIGFPR